MRKFMMATLLAGMSSLVVGCNESDAPTTAVPTSDQSGSKQATPGNDAPVSDTDTVPMVDLDEPEVKSDTALPVTELIVGDPAPPISIAKWVKGEPVKGFSKDSIYVVEFWATWCGPCLASMPHIASLQTEYGDKVTFIGVTSEEEEVVSEFMDQTDRGGKKWSDILTYRIVIDKDRETNAAYMQAAGQNGIPCAFIVGRSGNVEWIGHPAAIDDTLKQVVDGTWDSETARKAFLADREAEAILQTMGPKINAALQTGDFKSAVGLIDQLITQFPDKEEFKMARFQFLLKGEMFEDANKAAAVLVEAAKDDAMELNQLAWILAKGVAGPGPDLDLALSAAKRAEEITESKDASVLDTLSHVLFARGDVDAAIAMEKKALEIAGPDEKDPYEAALKEFEAAASKGSDDSEKPSAKETETPADAPKADE